MRNHAGKVRLEVDASDITNVITNHSGQAGTTTGWSAVSDTTLTAVTDPTRGSETLLGTYTGGKAIKVTYGAAADKVYSPSFTLAAGEQVGGSFWVADSRVVTPGSELVVHCGFEFFDGSSVSLGSKGFPFQRLLQSGDDPWQMVEFFNTVGTAPADTVTARMFWFFRDGSILGSSPNRDLYLAKVMVVTSAGPDSSESVRDVSFGEGTVWQNVLGSATSAKIRRGGQVDGCTDKIDAGTLTATVTDPIMDPAQNARMRVGRQVRFMALDETTGEFRPLFTGRVDHLDVSYADKYNPEARPSVTLTAVDAVAELAKTTQPFNYAGGYGPKVKALMAGSTVPYVADAGSASTDINHRDRDQGRLWDQLVLARNTFSGGRLWVDAEGTLQAVTVSPTGTPDHEFHDRARRAFTNKKTNPSYETDTTGTTSGISGISVAVSSAWSEQGTKSALINKTSVVNTGLNLTFATSDASKGIYVAQGEFFSARVAIKAVMALTFDLMAFERPAPNGTILAGPYSLGSVTLAAGAVGVIDVNHKELTDSSAAFVDIYLQSTATAATGDMAYIDGLCMINEGSTAAGWDTVPYADTSGVWEPVGTAYTGVDVNFGSGTLVNEVMIVANNDAEPDGSKEYGPYMNALSQADWGVEPAQVQVVDPSSPSTLAETYLERFADPTIFPRTVTFRAADADAEALFTDVYDQCRVVHGPSGTDAVVPALSVEHVITPKRWDVTLGFRPETSTAVTVTNPAAGANTGPDDVAGAVGASGSCFGSRGLSTAGGQSINSSTVTTVELNLDVEATNINWSSNQFTVPYNGRYLIIGRVTYKPGATSGYFQVGIQVNGSEVATDINPFPVSQYNAAKCTDIKRLTKGDTVRLSTYQTSGAARTLHESADGRFSYLRVTYLGV